jgi:tripartite-type tricarboxylate transporter receptor subunit TctC
MMLGEAPQQTLTEDAMPKLRRSGPTWVLGILGALLLSASPSLAQRSWPHKTVRVIVPIGTGTGTDVAARLFAERLAQRWKQPVIVENRTGADSMVGIHAFTSTHDDHTLLFSFASPISVFPFIQEKLPYDPARDIVPIASATDPFIALAASAGLKIDSMADLTARARAHPGTLLYNATAGALPYLFSGFLKSASLDMLLVPYREYNLAAQDLGEGRLHVMMTTMRDFLPGMQAGKVRLLAVTNKNRAPIAPEVPTAVEAGYPILEFEGLLGFFGPRDIPSELQERIAADVRAVAVEPALADRLTTLGQIARGSTPAGFSAAIEEQRAKMAAIVKLIGAKPPE